MFVRACVCPVQVCLELSIFIFLTQILKLLSLAVSQQSFNSLSVGHHTVGALNTSSCFVINNIFIFFSFTTRRSPSTRYFFLHHILVILSMRTPRTASTLIKYQSSIQIIIKTFLKMLSNPFMILWMVSSICSRTTLHRYMLLF